MPKQSSNLGELGIAVMLAVAGAAELVLFNYTHAWYDVIAASIAASLSILVLLNFIGRRLP